MVGGGVEAKAMNDTYLRSAFEDLLRAANAEYAEHLQGSTKLILIHAATQAVTTALQMGESEGITTYTDGQRGKTWDYPDIFP